MTVSYSPTFGEQYRATGAIRRRSWKLRYGVPAGALVGGAGAYWLLRGDDTGAGLVVWAVAVALVFLSPLPTAWAIWRMRRADRGRDARVRLTVDETSITVADPRGEQTLTWPLVREVAETGEFLLFYVAENTAFFLPKRAVGGPGELDTLRDLARRAREAHARTETVSGQVTEPAAVSAVAPAARRGAGPAVTVRIAPGPLEEWMAGQRVWYASREGKRYVAVFVGVPLLLLALFWLSLGFRPGVTDNLYLLWGGAAVVFAVFPLLGLLGTGLRWALRRGARPVGTFTLDGRGVTVTDAAGSVTVAWAALARVQETRGYFLFWLDRDHARWLPRRALGGPEGERRVREAVARYARIELDPTRE